MSKYRWSKHKKKKWQYIFNYGHEQIYVGSASSNYIANKDYFMHGNKIVFAEPRMAGDIITVKLEHHFNEPTSTILMHPQNFFDMQGFLNEEN